MSNTQSGSLPEGITAIQLPTDITVHFPKGPVRFPAGTWLVKLSKDGGVYMSDEVYQHIQSLSVV